MKLKKLVALATLAVCLGTGCSIVSAEEMPATEAAQATTQTVNSTDNSAEAGNAETTEEAQRKNAATTQAVSGKTAGAKKATKAKKKAAKKKRSVKKYTKQELRYMSAIIYCEAGNQSYAGKLAVGIVVKNRMESRAFPNSIHSVLYQRSQFTPTRNGSFRRALRTYDRTGFKSSNYAACKAAAKEALSGNKTVKIKGGHKSMKGYLYFSRYIAGCRVKIGAHMFK